MNAALSSLLASASFMIHAEPSRAFQTPMVGMMLECIAAEFPGLHSCIMITKSMAHKSTMWPLKGKMTAPIQIWQRANNSTCLYTTGKRRCNPGGVILQREGSSGGHSCSAWHCILIYGRRVTEDLLQEVWWIACPAMVIHPIQGTQAYCGTVVKDSPGGLLLKV